MTVETETGYCPHGTYVGGSGPDYICSDCEHPEVFMTPKDGDALRIAWLVDRMSVATPDEEVRRDILRRVRSSGFGYPQGYDIACADYAVAHHHANRDLYRGVMSGGV